MWILLLWLGWWRRKGRQSYGQLLGCCGWHNSVLRQVTLRVSVRWHLHVTGPLLALHTALQRYGSYIPAVEIIRWASHKTVKEAPGVHRPNMTLTTCVGLVSGQLALPSIWYLSWWRRWLPLQFLVPFLHGVLPLGTRHQPLFVYFFQRQGP